MNKSEYLLACLAEEASEIIKAVQKAQRFGLDNGNPFDKEFISNRDSIRKEIIDLLAVGLMLEQVDGIQVSDLIDLTCTSKELAEKILKVERYMKESRKVGALDDEEG